MKDPQEVPSTIGFASRGRGSLERLYTVVEPQVEGHQHSTIQSWSNVHTLRVFQHAGSTFQMWGGS